MPEKFWNRIALQPQALDPRLRSSIRRSFFAYAALLLLIGWAYAAWYIGEDHKRTVSLAGEQLRAIATSLNAQMEAMLGDGMGSAESAVKGVRRSGPLGQLPFEQIATRLRDEVTGDYIRALFVGNEVRTIVAGQGFSERIEGVPRWLVKAPSTWQTTVMLPISDPSRPGRNVIPLARGVDPGNQELGWYGMWFDVNELLARYQAIGIDKGAISIVRADGWLLAGTSISGGAPPQPTYLGQTELFDRLKMLAPGRVHVLEGISALDGKRKLFAISKAGGDVPLNLVASREYQAIIAPWKRNTVTVLWLALGSSALVIVMTMLLYRFLHEINRRESQFQKLFENSLASVLLLKDQRIVEKNHQARKTFRVPDNQTLYGRKFEEISADTQADGTRSCEAMAAHREQLRRGGGVAFRWLFKRLDTGQPFEAEVNISTIQVAGDVVRLALVRDISEQEAVKRELQRVNLQLEARVAQRTADLQKANAQLAASNRELEEFTASASHDLRSPLSVISGQAGLLEIESGARLGNQGRERLKRVQQAVRRAAEVIEGLLSLARIARQDLQAQPVNLSEIARTVIDELRELDPQREADVHIDPEMCVHADRGLMTSLVSNLLSNAWKYSSKRSRVWIRFERTEREDSVVYCVADRGAGFSMEQAAGLFQAFRRLHPIEEFNGIGLGLATVERIVIRYGGKIWAEAEPDVGAKFFFTLPNAQPVSVPIEATSDRTDSQTTTVF